MQSHTIFKWFFNKTRLWNEEGGFFCFDTTEQGSDTVMSDQLCGMWYLSLVDASLRKCRGEEGVEEQVEVEDDVDVEEPALFEGIKVGMLASGVIVSRVHY